MESIINFLKNASLENTSDKDVLANAQGKGRMAHLSIVTIMTIFHDENPDIVKNFKLKYIPENANQAGTQLGTIYYDPRLLDYVQSLQQHPQSVMLLEFLKSFFDSLDKKRKFRIFDSGAKTDSTALSGTEGYPLRNTIDDEPGAFSESNRFHFAKVYKEFIDAFSVLLVTLNQIQLKLKSFLIKPPANEDELKLIAAYLHSGSGNLFDFGKIISFRGGNGILKLATMANLLKSDKEEFRDAITDSLGCTIAHKVFLEITKPWTEYMNEVFGKLGLPLTTTGTYVGFENEIKFAKFKLF